MAKRYSIYATPTLDAVLADRTSGDEGLRSRSATISAIADRYAEITRRTLPKLSTAEWCLIFDATNGCWMQEQAQLLQHYVLANVADAIALDGLDKKWSVDGGTLTRKLAALDYPTDVAIVDASERFWEQVTRGNNAVAPGEIVGKRCIDDD